MWVNDMRGQWKTAGRYGTRGDLVRETGNAFVELIWLCKIRRQHQEKYGSRGTCIRCGKAVQ